MTMVMELGSSESIQGAIEAGMGITTLPRSTIGKELLDFIRSYGRDANA